jgi:hypothetical protein
MICLDVISISHGHVKLIRPDKHLDRSNVFTSLRITFSHIDSKNTELTATNVVGPSPLLGHTGVATPRLVITLPHAAENDGTNAFLLGWCRRFATTTTASRRRTSPLSSRRWSHRRVTKQGRRVGRRVGRIGPRRSRIVRDQVNPRRRGQVVTRGCCSSEINK